MINGSTITWATLRYCMVGVTYRTCKYGIQLVGQGLHIKNKSHPHLSRVIPISPHNHSHGDVTRRRHTLSSRPNNRLFAEIRHHLASKDLQMSWKYSVCFVAARYRLIEYILVYINSSHGPKENPAIIYQSKILHITPPPPPRILS